MEEHLVFVFIYLSISEWNISGSAKRLSLNNKCILGERWRDIYKLRMRGLGIEIDRKIILVVWEKNKNSKRDIWTQIKREMHEEREMTRYEQKH